MLFKFFLIISCASFSSGDLNGRIVGGNPVDIKSVPYQVEIQYFSYHLCGGAIISDKWILSAAHCFFDRINPTQYSVRAGSSRRLNSGVVYTVKRIIPHEKFNKVITFDYDFCLLEFSIKFNENVSPVKMVHENQELSDGTKCFVTGWGNTLSETESEEILRGVEVPIINFQSCVNIFRGLQFSPRMFCAGYLETGLKDSCQGDSGGPIVSLDDKLLIGIVSWGLECAQPNKPGVYSRISTVRDWIYYYTGI